MLHTISKYNVEVPVAGEFFAAHADATGTDWFGSVADTAAPLDRRRNKIHSKLLKSITTEGTELHGGNKENTSIGLPYASRCSGFAFLSFFSVSSVVKAFPCYPFIPLKASVFTVRLRRCR